jgi:hydrogenase/urease accessory protein HupE
MWCLLMRKWWVLWLMILAPMATAHKLAPSLLILTERDGGEIAVEWKTPATRVTARAMHPVFPDDCVERSPASGQKQGTGLLSRWVMACDGPLAGMTISIEGMMDSATATLVKVHQSDGSQSQQLINAQSAVFTVPRQQSVWQVASAYTELGLEHIWAGLDHLLFVLALVLLVPTLRQLVWTITAFTLGHSITLSLVTLGVVNFPTSVVEFAIAASLFILAVELAQGAKGNSKEAGTKNSRWIPNHSWLVAVAFGLLHGMGFAGALKEVGLPTHDIPLALLSFNIGIELGQVAFVMLCLAIAGIMTRQLQRWVTPGWWASVYGIGGLSVMWCIERSF